MKTACLSYPDDDSLSVKSLDINIFASELLDCAALLLFFKCSSLNTTDQQIFFTSSTYESLQNLFYDLSYTILGPAFGTVVILDMTIIL